jgi:LmbE family N-acetylglucosaminyl deacetylase
MKKILLFVLCIGILPWGLSVTTGAEQTATPDATSVWQALQRLRTTATALATQAHPDDEDAALLTWLARGAGVRTGLLSLTRGEGGANLVGAEQYDALGILRTEEMSLAARQYGLDAVFYTRAVDFGFSKRLDETFTHWDKDAILRDVVRQIRAYRPDIIVSRFHGAARDGHGNHQAAGLLTREAFKAAADPNVFPEQLKEGLRPWQVKKLYLSLRGNESNETGATLKIDTNEKHPLLQQTYRELGTAGYAKHASQFSGGSPFGNRPAVATLRLVESTLPAVTEEKTIFDQLDTTIPGLAKVAGSAAFDSELAELNRQIEAAIIKFDAKTPSAIHRELVAAARVVRAIIAKVPAAKLDAAKQEQFLILLNHKDREINEALNLSLGLSFDLTLDNSTDGFVIPGQSYTLTHGVLNPSPVKLNKTEYLVQTPPNWLLEAKPFDEVTSKKNVRQRVTFKFTVPADAQLTRPHWSRRNELRDHAYNFNQLQYRGLPVAPPEIIGWFNYEIEGVKFHLTQPAQAINNGERRLVTVVPAMNVTLTPRTGIALRGNALKVAINVQSNVAKAAGKVRLKLPAGWSAAPSEQAFSFAQAGQAAFAFTLTPQAFSTVPVARVEAIAEFNGRAYSEGYQFIAHPEHEPRALYRPAAMEIRAVTADIAPDLHIGYVMGVGDEVPQALEQLGVKVTMLDAQALASGELNGYDAILVGIRATAVRADLKTHYQRLLAYAENGGHLIYQYQTPEFDAAPYAPYPYTLTPRAEEVSEEDSQVTVLDAAHPYFNWPNKITAADFDNWVEERGSKWMTTWDERFQPLLECHDREQPPQKGGLMFARTGKGTFTYAAYAFYRQLPAGVPGAYRLFANIVSFKKRTQ